jgi:predicted RNA-binding Zn ribbon-like protein
MQTMEYTVHMAQPAARSPAPGSLALVQEFVNTNDIENGRDRLAEPRLLRDWLLEHSLLRQSGGVSPSGHRDALEVREALRALMVANNGGPPAPAAASLLTDALARSKPRLRFARAPGERAVVEVTSAGPAGAVGALLVAVYDAMREGTWPRMKACTDPRCHWAFYDHSRNASGRWCSMAVCGMRAKVETAAARARRGGKQR